MRKSLIAIGCLLGLSACSDIGFGDINRYTVSENNVVTTSIEGRCNGKHYSSRIVKIKCLTAKDTIKEFVISPSVYESISYESIGRSSSGEYPFKYHRVTK